MSLLFIPVNEACLFFLEPAKKFEVEKEVISIKNCFQVLETNAEENVPLFETFEEKDLVKDSPNSPRAAFPKRVVVRPTILVYNITNYPLMVTQITKIIGSTFLNKELTNSTVRI